MAAIFPKSSDLVLKVAGAVIGLGALAGVGAYTYYSYPTVIDTGYTPVQPVPYSHKLHAGQLGLDCFYCHSTVYKAAYAAIPAGETCMNCHVKVKDKSPRLDMVRNYYAGRYITSLRPRPLRSIAQRLIDSSNIYAL